MHHNDQILLATESLDQILTSLQRRDICHLVELVLAGSLFCQGIIIENDIRWYFKQHTKI